MLGSLQGLPPSNHQQQGQQQQLQQPQQQLQQNQLNTIPPPPPQNGQDVTLSSVLHFLQSEWRRYERDRNEWEIERAEMRARIALLEGEKRSFDNVKLDLMRRIKMLEFVLRMERSKQLTQPGPSSKLAVIQAHESSTGSKDDSGSHKEESGGSSPRSEDSPLPESRLSNGGLILGAGGSPITSLGKAPLGRDPKSRARSRDYLKQCLQEISYLTSPQAMNPLPNRPLLTNSSIPLSLPNVPSFDQIPYNGRPRKVLVEGGKDFPLLNGLNTLSLSAPVIPGSQNTLDRNPLAASSQSNTNSTELSTQQPSSGLLSQEEKEKEADSDNRQITAIYRPDDAGEWKERLRQSHEAAEQAHVAKENQTGVHAWESRRDDDDMKDPDIDMYDEESSVVGEGEDTKIWKAKRTLRNHLDAVRAVAFHPNELCLATGGDDCTVKIWRMEVSSLSSPSTRPTTEVEPQLTLRGHSAAITRLIHSPSKYLLYSASLDSSIRVWALPTPSHTTYAPYDETRVRGELIGHTDAVWDLALVKDENTLVSCGAEGTVKVWDVGGPSGGGSLKLSWRWNGLGSNNDFEDEVDVSGATSVEVLKTDFKKVAVAYQNAVVKIFDIETGKEQIRLQSDTTYDGTSATQINCIASHPSMPLLVTAHEDKYIKIFDVLTGQCTHSMLAHLDSVTSLSIDTSGFTLVSGSHDCSVRFWDMAGSRTCIQEITTHREKAREGVLDVEFHPTMPVMVSAGADGVVKLYASS
ncbi:1,2-dihydroxy-3-keto-5-methylthiopentene dioxygenase [Leucoagaricus gongylophorus]